jgi:hypothetical protein
MRLTAEVAEREANRKLFPSYAALGEEAKSLNFHDWELFVLSVS